jgi:hypothetical protein
MTKRFMGNTISSAANKIVKAGHAKNKIIVCVVGKEISKKELEVIQLSGR